MLFQLFEYWILTFENDDEKKKHGVHTQCIDDSKHIVTAHMVWIRFKKNVHFWVSTHWILFVGWLVFFENKVENGVHRSWNANKTGEWCIQYTSVSKMLYFSYLVIYWIQLHYLMKYSDYAVNVEHW